MNLEITVDSVAVVVILIYHKKEAVIMKLELVLSVPTMLQAPTVRTVVIGGTVML